MFFKPGPELLEMPMIVNRNTAWLIAMDHIRELGLVKNEEQLLKVWRSGRLTQVLNRHNSKGDPIMDSGYILLDGKILTHFVTYWPQN